jgi:citronellol/citronellal dehydrogenase
MTSLKNKTLFITGASRGIGKAIGLRAARDGANVAIAAKTAEPHPKLPGTIYTAAEEMDAAGGRGLALEVDIRFEDQIVGAMETTAEIFGGIDILINNASAINLTDTRSTPMKRYDLMHQVNVRGTFACSQAALPYLEKAANPHILNLSPPLSMKAKWFQNHVAYTMSKFGMSMCVLGMSAEFAEMGIAVNALWPKSAIATAAMKMLAGEDNLRNCRKPEIVADAAYIILTRNSRECTGNFFIDEQLLHEMGVTDLTQYAMDPTADIMPDFFVD